MAERGPDRPMMGEKASPKQSRALWLAIVVLIVLGAVTTYATVSNSYADRAATKADVERNAELTQQLTFLTEQLATNQDANATSAERFRNDSRRQITSICTQVHAIAVELRVPVPACPVVPAPVLTTGP